MKVIYHCYGGTHSSALCAAIHLGIISARHIPSYKEIMECPYFDKVSSSQVGALHYMGSDREGNDIYILGCRSCGAIVEKAVKEMVRIMGIVSDQVIMVDTTPCLNVLLKIGGFLSRRLGMVKPGRVLLYYGCRLAYLKCKCLVKTVQGNLDREGIYVG